MLVHPVNCKPDGKIIADNSQPSIEFYNGILIENR